ncbi:hypothetical protein DL95DRAFT_178926, partial [Leptodontidium sp. 2 PMI_412]
MSPAVYNETMPDSWNFASAFFNCMPPTFAHVMVASNPISYHLRRGFSTVPTDDLIDPRLRDAVPVSAPVPPATTHWVEDAHKTIPTTGLKHTESMATQSLCGSQGVEDQPVAINAKENIWTAEALLAQWKQRKTTYYFVKCNHI